MHFIRHLPTITEEELSAMEQMNPRPRAEWDQLREEEKFLGEEEAVDRGAQPAESQPHHH